MRKHARAMLAAGQEINVRRLAEDCGVSVGTIYNSYSTIDALVLDIAAELWSEAAAAVETQPPEALTSGLVEWLSRAEHRRLLLTLNMHPAMRRIFSSDEAPSQALGRLRNALTEKFAQLCPDRPTSEHFQASTTVVICFRFLQAGLSPDASMVSEKGDEFRFAIDSLSMLLKALETGLLQRKKKP